MNQAPPPFTNDEFEELAAWLERRSKGISDIVELEGLLTAVVIGPNWVHPTIWLAKAWGGKNPKFQDLEELNRFVGLVMGLHNDLALLYVQSGDVPAAASEFRESLRLSPDSPAAYYNVANCELMLHRPATAEILFRQALLRRSDYGLAQQGLALALEAQGRLQEAATQFASAIELLPTAEAHYNFGALRR
jgi:tetratricopeptide (TPR) repeat protein